MNSINFLINQYFLDSSSFSFEKLVRRLGTIKNKEINFVYGETYDQYGLTLDSLKYYFFIALLRDSLKLNNKVNSNIIIGDLHSIKNKIVQNKDFLLTQSKGRVDFIRRINDIYGVDIKVELMSDKFKTDGFKKNLKTITKIFNESLELQGIAKKTVLKNRLTQEEAVGFQYTLEEVALIIDYDLKVGPPREIYYDQMTNLIKKKSRNQEFVGVYLKPTFPLGVKFDFYICHPEIEKFGLTPYKAGSNKLQDFRIILNDTCAGVAKDLINSSFISSNLVIPNPVLDIYLICQMAESFLSKKQFSVDEELIKTPESLKKVTYEKFVKNILKPLNFN